GGDVPGDRGVGDLVGGAVDDQVPGVGRGHRPVPVLPQDQIDLVPGDPVPAAGEHPAVAVAPVVGPLLANDVAAEFAGLEVPFFEPGPLVAGSRVGSVLGHRPGAA